MNNSKKYFDVQGHRGARGVYPENSIPGFIYALQIGVTTLEMDVIISADGKLVVSHEPWLSPDICSHQDGSPVTREEQAELNMYRMTYGDIRKYNCGSRGNPRFPGQKKMPVHKPLLSEVVDMIEKIINEKSLRPIYYNIETKSMPKGDMVNHPVPSEFAKLLMGEIKRLGIQHRVVIQSFDIRTLEAMHDLDPEMKYAFLEGADGEFSSKLSDLSFTPAIHSPDYHLVNDLLIDEAHSKKIRVIPWTVNDTSEMKRLIDLGVDGIITDYPADLLKLLGRAPC